MQYVVSKTETKVQNFAIEADSPEEARKKVDAGEGTSISLNENEQNNVQPRPQAQPAGAALTQPVSPLVGRKSNG